MRNRLFPALFFLAMVLAVAGDSNCATEPASPLAFYVDPAHGNDRWSGQQPGFRAQRKDGPFQSLERARAAVRTLRAHDGLPSAGVIIWLANGEYRVRRTLVFGPDDGGTIDSPVVYAALPKTRVVWTGGVLVRDWQRDGNGLWSAPLPEAASVPRQLYVNGVRRPRARTPNQGYDEGLVSEYGRTIVFPPATRLPSADDLDREFCALVEWTATRTPFHTAKIEAQTASFPRQVLPLLELAGHIKGNVSHFPYALENGVADLDQPGEWRTDSRRRRLIYWPLSGEDPRRVAVIIPQTETLVAIEGTRERPVENLHFRGITFQDTHWRVPDDGFTPIQANIGEMAGLRYSSADGPAPGVLFHYARHCSLEDCRVINQGGNGIDLHLGAQSCAVIRTEIGGVSGNGVRLGTPQLRYDHPADLVRDNTIAHCRIHDLGLDYQGAIGIANLITEHSVLTHNEIWNGPYTGIKIGCNWDHTDTACKSNQVTFNRIHDVVQLLADGGGITALGKQPGSVMEGNVIYNLKRRYGIAGDNGIFLDEGSDGWTLSDNVIYAVADAPLRYNNTEPKFVTMKRNYFGVAPGDPGFPQTIADEAGPVASPAGLLP